MGKHIHRLSERDMDAQTAICANCGPVSIKVYGNTYRCAVAYAEWKKRSSGQRAKTPYHLKGDTCARCGFVGELCQMDLDHIDGDRSNHYPENMQTLCANCHRLKTWLPSLF